MTIYTFVANFRSAAVNWQDTSIWLGGIVPNAPDADVVIPMIANVTPGNATTYDITLGTEEAYAARSVAIAGNGLIVSGSLAVSGDLTVQQNGYLNVGGLLSVSGTLALQQPNALLMSGGTLSFGSLQNTSGTAAGYGTINSASNVLNAGSIYSDGTGLVLSFYGLQNSGLLSTNSGNLTINIGAVGFQNTGTLSANQSEFLTVNTTAGAFGNLSGGALTGGTYSAYSGGTLNFNVGGVITTDAATINLSGGTISSYDSSTFTSRPLEATLQTIAPSGVLTIANETYTTSDALTVSGNLTLLRTTYGAPAGLSAAQLAVTAGGQISGYGIITGQVTNNGIITAGYATPAGMAFNFGAPLPPQSLVIQSALSGTGSLLVGAGVTYYDRVPYPATTYGTVLELGATVAEDVRFADSTGILQLDAPGTFSGTIAPASTGDTVVLENIALSSIMSQTYTGDTEGGTLVLHRTAGDLSFNFRGNYTVNSFTLTAGVQQTSTSPPSVIIAPTASAAGDFSKSDIVLQDNTGSMVVWNVDGTTVPTTAYLGNPTAAWQAVGIADFNGDNRPDIIMQSTDGVLVDYFLNAPGTHIDTSGVLGSPGATWHVRDTADFSGVGNASLLLQDATGSMVVWGVNGTAVTSTTYLGNPGANWHIMGSGDFNGDGHVDILVQSDDGAVVDYLMNGVSIGVGNVLGTPGATWHVRGIDDFNNDGRSDIVLQDNTGSIVIWNTNGTAVTGSTFLGNPGADWHVEGVADYNNDDRPDILMQSEAGAFVDYLMNGITITGSAVLGTPGMGWRAADNGPMQLIDGTGAATNLNGTPGADEFILISYVAGLHQIAAFDPTQDIIAFSKTLFPTFEQVQVMAVPYQGGTFVLLTPGSALVIQGVTPDQLHASNFALS